MRLFIAIQFTDEVKKNILSVMHDLKKAGVTGNYVPAQNLHLTLAFIGEMESSDPVKEAMNSVRAKPFKLNISELGNFGDLLWIGAKGNQGLSQLVKSLRDALDTAGIDYDRKKFVPHVTIIRKFSGNRKQVAFPKTEMTVKKISLMKSSVKDGKRVYTEISSVSI